MKFMTYFLTSILLSILPAAAENLLRDGALAEYGQANNAWVLVTDARAKVQPVVEAAKGPNGTGALRLRAAVISQQLTLPAGLYELTVQARGQGELMLAAEGIGERAQLLGNDWGTYGYLFEAKAGTASMRIGISVDGVISAATLQPATAEQQAAWATQQDGLVQYGFIIFSAQRPSPGAAPLDFTAAKPLEAMTNRAVLDEPRMNTGHVKNEMRLVEWLGAHGFQRLNGEAMAAWMLARVKEGAYGSVMVMCRGLGPTNLVEGTPDKPGESLYIQYLRAGGRIVNVGDLPFYNLEQPSVRPPDLGSGGGSLGLYWGWSSPYWGQGNLPVTLAPAGKAWGIETVDGSITGFAVESISLAFSEFTVPATGKKGAASWFKNLRPDMPWSGMIKMLQNFDANNDAQIRDAWRAAHYVGKPVVIPPLPAKIAPPPTLPVRVTFTTGGMTGRKEFVRGEKVTAEVTAEASVTAKSVRIELLQGKTVLFKEEKPLTAGAKNSTATFILNTGPYAYGAYQVQVTAAGAPSVTETIGIRYIPPEYFNWEMWHGAGSNPLRADLEFKDIRDAGFELYLTTSGDEGLLRSVDIATRVGIGFSMRAHPELKSPRLVDFDKTPEFYRINNDGKPIGTAYSGGRPSVGISHPDIRESATHSMAEDVKKVAGHPAFRPYVLTNDDFSIYYGWDYAPHVLADFTAKTGLEAPRTMELPAKFGAIPENNPWLRWFEYTCIHVNGAFNKAETAGVVQARPDARVGPIPGGMQIPLVQLWQPAQYPPYNFGKNGFNLLSCYYYNTYWQPVLTNTFWMEIGRMGNRDLPEWCMPDCFMTAGYSRNNLFHLLAGGVRGLAYFTYRSRNTNSWPEFARLGKIVRRIGPVQAKIAPARRDIGMLNSFTTNCFDPGHTLVQVYGYHNLMQGHFDVEMVSEDEIVAGRASQYKAVVLYNVKYLRQSVYDALAAHAAKGGLVVLDNTIPFDIPGAKRLAVDIGMGTQRTLGMPPEGAHASTPGIRDYGILERINVIKTALSQYVKPRFGSDDIKIVASSFTAGGVPYTWYVNVHDGKEYMFCRERMGAGHPGGGTPEKVKELKEWEIAEMGKGPYTSTVVLAALPGVPYDLVAGKIVPVTKTTDGQFALTLSMERFGGALVTFLSGDITALKLAAPQTAKAGIPVQATATILAGAKPVPGVLSVEFTLKDPAGNDSVISGVRGTANGKAAFTWTPAVNDLPGVWTLEATELASGKTAQVKIRLGK
ncbi:MAG: hypothetical protein ACYC7E_20150 [Armatimonadota bacterium]